MTRDMLLHAGPPITWDKMCGPMRGAVIGALLYEGRATTAEEAARFSAQARSNFHLATNMVRSARSRSHVRASSRYSS